MSTTPISSSPRRYTDAGIASKNLGATIASLEQLRSRHDGSSKNWLSLVDLLLLNGEVRGRISDYERARAAAIEATELEPASPLVLLALARVLGRFHRFEEALENLNKLDTLAGDSSESKIERAGILHALGHLEDARDIWDRVMSGPRTWNHLLGVAPLLSELGQPELCKEALEMAAELYDGVAPFPIASIHFQLGLAQMKARSFHQAIESFSRVLRLLPYHAPANGHLAEVYLEVGRSDQAARMLEPVLTYSDDPEYHATYAEALVASGNENGSKKHTQLAAAGYTALLTKHPEAYADHAARFFLGIGNDPARASHWAAQNLTFRHTPQAQALLAEAVRRNSATPSMKTRHNSRNSVPAPCVSTLAE